MSFLFLLFVSALLVQNQKLQNKSELNSKANKVATLEQLRSLPYLSWSQNEIKDKIVGVVKYDHSRSNFGYNLYTDDAENAYLINMNGVEVYSWQFPPIKGKWEYVELLNDGEIVAINVGKCFAKIDRYSRVIWIKYLPVHHDIAVLSDGTFLVPVYSPRLYNLRGVTFDSILHISNEGEILDEWCSYAYLDSLKTLHSSHRLDTRKGLAELLTDLHYSAQKFYFFLRRADEHDIRNSKNYYQKYFYNHLLNIPRLTRAIYRKLGYNYDYYHLNTVEVLPETDLGREDKRFQKGNILICLRNVSLILILDKTTKDIVWSFGPGVLDWPHMPTMLENGNILIFDNGVHRTYSRILEINPVNSHIVWEYLASPPENFYSKWRGSNQRLPNGNTLVCESEKGRVFEVTPQGDIVWEFFNPEIKNGRRKLIYRMMRITDVENDSFLLEMRQRILKKRNLATP